eukprot:TRINITY_DN6982_c0_g1_i1.p1 TRINITY_DN6982_c0_g1~~TRINITY_DN6982_c0_g1_i1.p1  ORF type:complete len:341 (-),score=62.20 TRINITY_DN6982_c0_g1_i1:40-1062(-)
MPNYIIVFGVKYYGKINTRTSARFKCRDYCYGKRLNITFDTPQEFREKVLKYIPDDIKAKYLSNENVPKRILTIEDEVALIKEDIKDVKISTTNRFNTVEYKIEANATNIVTNTVSIETLRAEYEAKIKELEEHNQSQDIIIAEQGSKIVSLQTRVSEVESENKDLRKDVSTLQRTVSKHETTISHNVREIKYLNENQRKMIQNGVKEEVESNNNYFQEKIDNLHNLIESFDIQSLKEIVNENRQITGEDRKNLSKLNKLFEEFNIKNNIQQEKLEEKNLENVEITNDLKEKFEGIIEKMDKQYERHEHNIGVVSTRSKTNRDLLKLTHKERQRRLNGRN